MRVADQGCRNRDGDHAALGAGKASDERSGREVSSRIWAEWEAGYYGPAVAGALLGARSGPGFGEEVGGEGDGVSDGEWGKFEWGSCRKSHPMENTWSARSRGHR